MIECIKLSCVYGLIMLQACTMLLRMSAFYALCTSSDFAVSIYCMNLASLYYLLAHSCSPTIFSILVIIFFCILGTDTHNQPSCVFRVGQLMEALKKLGDDDHTSKSNSDDACSPHQSAEAKPEGQFSSINSQRLVELPN